MVESERRILFEEEQPHVSIQRAILCPYHNEQETLTLPDEYDLEFSGEVPCGGEKVDRATLHITLKGVKVFEVKVVSVPAAGS